MESLANEYFHRVSVEKRSLEAFDARTDRTKILATDLVMEYMTNVAILYAIPMCELLERLKIKVLQEHGNG